MKTHQPFFQRLKSWRYLSRNQQQALSLVALALLLLLSLAWSEPVSGLSGDPSIDKATHTSAPVILDETVTPFPPEMLNNKEQADGVILLGGVIVLIIILGTVGVARSRRDR